MYISMVRTVKPVNYGKPQTSKISLKKLRSCKEINFTSFAKYPEVILGIDGEAHT